MEKNKYENHNFIYFVSFNSPFDEKKDKVNITITKYQIFNRFPNGKTYKDGINIFYNKLKEKFPNDFNYIPETYLWPEQSEQLIEKFLNYTYNQDDVWLYKPTRQFGARGVHIFESIKELRESDRFLLTKYINPMLIDRKKFDFRGFVLITGMNPLKIYLYRDGYLRITSKNFSFDKESIKDSTIHITTTAINSKNTEGYKYEENLFDDKASFWNYLTFEKYCNKNGINYTDIREQTKDLVIKSFISLNPDFVKILNKKKLKNVKLHQLYGLDIIIDRNYKVWLLEINRVPTMMAGHLSATHMYEHLAADILNVVGVVPFSHINPYQTMDNVYHYDDETEELVDEALCEFGRPRGSLELIFPLKKNIGKYKKYFENPSKENKLLWKKIMESDLDYS